MRKSWLFFILLLIAYSAYPQGQGNTVTIPYSSDPTGLPCSFIMLANYSGNEYYCHSGVFALLSGGGGGGVSSITGTANQIVVTGTTTPTLSLANPINVGTTGNAATATTAFGVFNVKAYGATGNGTTDDTTAIQAAITAAGNYGNVLFPPTSSGYLVTSQLSVPYSHQTWWGFGAGLICNQSTVVTCSVFGVPGGTYYTNYSGNTIYGLKFTPGSTTSATAAIEDGGQDTVIQEVNGGSGAGNRFSTAFIQVDYDENTTIRLYNMTGVVTCNATSCAPILYGVPGQQAIAHVIGSSNFSSNCTANGIDWRTGNHLTVSGAILQAWSQYALRSASPVDIDGWTHWEQGNCTNPLNDGSGHALGGAGLINLGSTITAQGSNPGGTFGTVFATNAVAGATTYFYYVVGSTAGGYTTAPLLAGYLTNGGSTVGGSAENFLVWPSSASIINWRVLRTTGGIPYGTGAYDVSGLLAASSICTASSGQVCAYTDATGAPASYSVVAESWYPGDLFWPGQIVLFGGPGAGTSTSSNVGSYSGPAVSFGMVNAAPSDTTFVHVNFTGLSNFFTNGAPSGPGFISMAHQAIADGPATGELYPRGSPSFNTKGWLNFGNGSYYGAPVANDYLTLQDSNWTKTLADWIKHPTWDAADTALCGDPPFSSGACLRGPTVSQYIGVLPDGSHWTTRTTSTGIADAVPHFGLSTISVGAPNTPSLLDVSALTTCATHTIYYIGGVCFDGTNFELAIWAGNNGSYSGTVAPTWAVTAGQTTVDNYVTFVNAGAGSLTANTAYYFKAAGCTVGGCSTPSAEATVTTANDGAAHMILATGTAKVGHTSYRVYCSTSTGTEALLTAPFTGAYTGAAYTLPAMGCSGSGSPNSSDGTGIIAGPATGLAFGATAISTSSTAPTSGQCLAYNGSNLAGTSCGGGGGSSAPVIAYPNTVNTSGAHLVSTGNAYSADGFTFTYGTLYLYPIYIPVASTIGPVTLYVSTAGSTGCVLDASLYSVDSLNWPSTLVSDGGSTSCASAGSITLGSPGTFAITTPGLYYVGLLQETSGLAAAPKAWGGTQTSYSPVLSQLSFGTSKLPVAVLMYSSSLSAPPSTITCQNNCTGQQGAAMWSMARSQ